ncbi:DUF1761 family protein [bacterium]|nr:DUF1761 family protein [bacterium]
MQFVAVIVAALVAYGFGAFWYMRMSQPWMAAAGIPVDANGRPAGNGSALPFVVGFVAELLVAGMMRHIFAMAQMHTIVEGIMGGFGIGAFLITPWVAMNYAFAARPYRLTLIDGVNSVVGCTLMGLVLTLI